jgi:hypothetical protein
VLVRREEFALLALSVAKPGHSPTGYSHEASRNS